MADIQATVLIDDSGDSFIDSDGLIDGAGNRFVSWGVQVSGSNNTYVSVMKYDRAGAIVGTWSVLPTPGQKIDECVLMHTGNDLIVQIDCHQAVPEKPRRLTVESAVIPGVYVRVAGQEMEEGGDHAFQPTGESEVSVDYDRIKSDTQTIVNTALHVIVDNMKSKAAAAISEQGVITEGNIHSSAGLYQRFTETTFEQVDKVMELRGVGHPIPRNEPESSTATESPRP